MPRASFKILDVLAVSSEPAVKTGVLALPHAHTGCHRPRTDFANAPKAWRRSPHMAAEPQPRSGALAVAATGPAGSAVENPYAATAALSDAPGIETAVGPTRRGRRRRGKSGRPPRPRGADTSAARPRFNRADYRQFVSGRVEPFSPNPDLTLPGTLHHSGNKPAPPSDHIPLARRGAFWTGQEGQRLPLRAFQIRRRQAASRGAWERRQGGLATPTAKRGIAPRIAITACHRRALS